MSLCFIISFLSVTHYINCNFAVENVDLINYYVTSTKISSLENNWEIQRNFTNSPLIFTIYFKDGLRYQLNVKLRDTDVWNLKTKLYIYEENSEDHGNVENKHYGLVEGYITSNEDSSFVSGYIINVYFYGSVYVSDKFYYLEDLNNYPHLHSKYNNSRTNAVVYETKRNFKNFEESKLKTDEPIRFMKRSYENEESKNLFKSIIRTGKVCTLFVLIDNSFLRLIHNNDVQSAVKHVLNTIEEVNSLFRSTDFDNDGYPDNIGFLIKYFVVLQSQKSPMNLVPNYSKDAIDGHIYLQMLSRYQLLGDVCLGVAFTAQAFKKDIVGISYTAVEVNQNFFRFSVGGICDQPFINQPGRYLNTLAVSAKVANGNKVPQYIFDLSLAHELGHSFGSDHDLIDECRGHLMTDHTPENLERKHFVFSKCSKSAIVDTIINKGHCLVDDESQYCGNARIERGEDCDCGTVRDCFEYDVCCTPRGRKDACKLHRNKGYECHPSQGLCCSLNCRYKDLSNLGLHCKNFQKSCPCTGNSNSCSCGINGNCIGNVCNSIECTRMDLAECECPENIENMKCQTCCLYHGSCLPSRIITETEFKKNNSFVVNILNKLTTSDYGYKEHFCYKNQCVDLYFREVKTDDFCLLFGNLGVCSNDYKCIVPRSQPIYPRVDIRKRKRSNFGRNEIHSFKLIIMVSITIFVYLYIF